MRITRFLCRSCGETRLVTDIGEQVTLECGHTRDLWLPTDGVSVEAVDRGTADSRRLFPPRRDLALHATIGLSEEA